MQIPQLKIKASFFLIISFFLIQGCGSSGTNEDVLITLYLVNQDNEAIEHVPYQCDSMSLPRYTSNSGAFSFYEGENCKFDFLNFEGTNHFNPAYDELVYIVDYHLDGKGNIPYSCTHFRGNTYDEGHFEYEADDICLFYL